MILLEAVGQVEAVQLRQRIIENGDVGIRVARQFQRVAPVRGLTDDLVIGLRLDKVADPPTNGVVIIDNHDAPDRARHGSSVHHYSLFNPRKA